MALLGGYPRGQLDLLRIGEALSSQSLASKQPPPRLLEIEPARSYWDEDLLHPRVVLQPLSNGRALVTRKVVGDQVQLADGVRLGNRFEQLQVAFGVARRGSECESFAVAYPQKRAVDPDFLGTPTVFQGCLEMRCVRPATTDTGRGRIGAGAHRS